MPQAVARWRLLQLLVKGGLYAAAGEPDDLGVEGGVLDTNPVVPSMERSSQRVNTMPTKWPSSVLEEAWCHAEQSSMSATRCCEIYSNKQGWKALLKWGARW